MISSNCVHSLFKIKSQKINISFNFINNNLIFFMMIAVADGNIKILPSLLIKIASKLKKKCSLLNHHKWR